MASAVPPLASHPPTPSVRQPVIGITMGEPAGIGAEVVVKALADTALRKQARFVVFGLNEMLAYAADLAEIETFWHRLQHDAPRAEFELVHDVVVLDHDEQSFLSMAHAKATRQGGQASLAFLDAALSATGKPIEEGGVDAIVTAPICKASWNLAGCRFPGHTEFLQQRTRAKRSVMLFDSPELRVALATVHLPLMDVRNVLTLGAVYDAIDLGHQHVQSLGIASPRIAVCGLNPHASEDGLMGDEEARVITPAIEMAKSQGMDVSGPFPADTLFTAARRKPYDLIVAMYHDQGLIPVKMLAFDSAVNVTLGLPIIRTSPDHGTAFDRVGQNTADPGSMHAAISLAVNLARSRIAAQAD